METVGNLMRSEEVRTFIFLVDAGDKFLKPLEDFYRGKRNVEYEEIVVEEFDSDYEYMIRIMGLPRCRKVLYLHTNFQISREQSL